MSDYEHIRTGRIIPESTYKNLSYSVQLEYRRATLRNISRSSEQEIEDDIFQKTMIDTFSNEIIPDIFSPNSNDFSSSSDSSPSTDFGGGDFGGGGGGSDW